jgi:hypothetical protein
MQLAQKMKNTTKNRQNQSIFDKKRSKIYPLGQFFYLTLATEQSLTECRFKHIFPELL